MGKSRSLIFGAANRGIQDIGGPITRPRLLGDQSVSSGKSFLDLSRRLQSEPLSFPAHRLNVLGILRIELLTQPIVLEELRPRIPTFTQALLAREHPVWVDHLSASTHFGALEIHFDIIKLNRPHPLCDPPCESDATALPYLEVAPFEEVALAQPGTHLREQGNGGNHRRK